MDYAEAMNRLNDEISSALARGERGGLTDGEMIDELIRIAEELRPKANPRLSVADTIFAHEENIPMRYIRLRKSQ